MSGSGQGMLGLIGELAATGTARAVVVIRHGAREFVAGRHDLENPLTDAGRAAAHAFGTGLPPGFALRGYASPVVRCHETAALALAGYQAGGGAITRVRPMEGLGVFYTLDQMRMFRLMQAAGGLGGFVERWFAGSIPADVMLDADVAARAIARLLRDRLLAATGPAVGGVAVGEPRAGAGLDLLVSHDITLALLRHQLLGQAWDAVAPVAFLDGIVVYARAGEVWVASPHGAPRVLRV